MFQDDLQYKGKLTVMNRAESLNYFNVGDSDNEIEVIHQIVERLPAGSVLFIDECPVYSSPELRGDWSSLSNSRPDQVTVIVSIKAILEKHAGLSNKSVQIKLHKNVDKIELNRVYRTSSTLFNKIQEFHHFPVKMVETKVQTLDRVQGPEPVIFHYKNDISTAMKTWIQYKIGIDLNCSAESVRILYSNNCAHQAQSMFQETEYSSCLTHWTSFMGGECLVVVMFYSPEDKPWQLLEMASRAQFKVLKEGVGAYYSMYFEYSNIEYLPNYTFSFSCSSIETLNLWKIWKTLRY